MAELQAFVELAWLVRPSDHPRASLVADEACKAGGAGLNGEASPLRWGPNPFGHQLQMPGMMTRTVALQPTARPGRTINASGYVSIATLDIPVRVPTYLRKPRWSRK
jgi:hypothetical protein